METKTEEALRPASTSTTTTTATANSTSTLDDLVVADDDDVVVVDDDEVTLLHRQQQCFVDARPVRPGRLAIGSRTIPHPISLLCSGAFAMGFRV